MRGYIFTLFGVCIVSAVVRTVSPDGAMKKHIELLCSLCVASAMIIPLVSLLYSAKYDNIFDGIFDGCQTENYEEIYNSYLIEGNVSAVESAMSEELCDRLSVGGDVEVDVAVERLEEGYRVSGARVILGARAVAADPKIIRQYIYERLSCECEIIYNIFDEK